MSTSLATVFNSLHLPCPVGGPAAMQMEMNQQCSANIDAVCLPQISPMEATKMAGACASSCPPKARLFYSQQVPYATQGMGILPLATIRQLPGI